MISLVHFSHRVAHEEKGFKPRLHERFFACDGDAIFLKIVASPVRGENRMCSHPHTGDATDEKIAEKNREKFNELNFCDKITDFVRGWLHRRFSPRAGDATISKKSHHHRKQKIARVAAALAHFAHFIVECSLTIFGHSTYMS